MAEQRREVPLGLAYTLFEKSADGTPVRADPSRVFRAGDGVRIVIEPNSDGYLYVFTTENSGDAKMLFPDPRLGGGQNRIVRHVPTEIPSSREAQERYRWLYFDKVAASEKLYFVLARNPLPGIPSGAELARYCASYQGACPLRPSKEVWTALLNAASQPDLVSREATFGSPQTVAEREAVTRGISLADDAPGPSVIQMSSASGSEIVVVSLVLEHR